MQPCQHGKGDALIVRTKQGKERQQVDLLAVAHPCFHQMFDTLIDQHGENNDEQ
ncbi:hypothetical protein D3C78_1959170 [compost metagenome]